MDETIESVSSGLGLQWSIADYEERQALFESITRAAGMIYNQYNVKWTYSYSSSLFKEEEKKPVYKQEELEL